MSLVYSTFLLYLFYTLRELAFMVYIHAFPSFQSGFMKNRKGRKELRSILPSFALEPMFSCIINCTSYQRNPMHSICGFCCNTFPLDLLQRHENVPVVVRLMGTKSAICLQTLYTYYCCYQFYYNYYDTINFQYLFRKKFLTKEILKAPHSHLNIIHRIPSEQEVSSYIIKPK